MNRSAVTCEDAHKGTFGTRQYSLLASHGDQSVVVPRGGNAQLGELSIHLVAFDTDVNKAVSDASDNLQLGIFQVPTP